MKSRNLTSVVLIICTGIFPAAVTGCGSNVQDTVAKDSDWYSTVRFDVADHYKTGDRPVDDVEVSYAGMDGDKLYFVSGGRYEIPDDVDVKKARLDDYEFAFLDVFDLDGNLLKTVDLGSDLDIQFDNPHKERRSGLYFEADDNSVKDGKIDLEVYFFFEPSYEFFDYDIVYDVESGTVESCEPTTKALEAEGKKAIGRSSRYRFDGYLLDEYYSQNKDYFLIGKPDGSSVLIDIESQAGNLDTGYIQQVLYMGSGKVFIRWLTNAFNEQYYLLDMDKGLLTQYEEDVSWMINILHEYYGMNYVEETGYIIPVGTSLKKLDFEKKELTDVFSFNSCNINRRDIANFSVVSLTDDRIVLSGSPYSGYSSYNSDSRSGIYILTREDKNPNAGKQVISAATTGEFDYAFCDAVYRFNSTNRKYFIELDTKYSLKEMMNERRMDASSVYDAGLLDLEVKLTNQIIIDYMAGEGPDILLNSANFPELRNGEYLLDLSNEIDTSELFGNVVELAKDDGKLYQVPLSISLNGILTRSSYVEGLGSGFTYDTYEDFVKGPCNGNDPVQDTQCNFFINCLDPMYEGFVSGNSVDLNNSSVKDLADYTKEHISDSMAPEFYYYYVESIEGGIHDGGLTFHLLIDRYSMAGLDDLTLMGLPSYDGRGPGVSFTSSIAVSAKTKAKDACIEFINLLLSEDVQSMSAVKESYTPVNISAFEKTANEKIEDFNKAELLNVKLIKINGIDPEATPELIDPSVVDNYKDMVLSCSSVSTMDSAVKIIVYEEMPAYFTDQKSFEDVIKIINNRADTYVNERG